MITPPIQVPGVGPYSTKIVFVGEAPGGREVERGIPFCGPSGKILWEICEELKLRRESVYVTNVVKVRCPGDTVKRIKELGLSIEMYLPLLWNEIDAINPNVILALGNTALSALTGIINYNDSGIMKYRGSILPAQGHSYKVVATIHPASLLERQEDKELHSWKQLQFLRFDINRCIEESKFPEIRYRRRQLHIAYTAHQLELFFRKYEGFSGPCFIDIETFKGLPICIAFAWTPDEGISVPLVNLLKPNGGQLKISVEEFAGIYQLIANFLADEKIKKAGQNFNFDSTVLGRWGFNVKNFYADTMLMMHCIYPEMPKSLAFMASIYTNQPYWKDEGREYNPKKDNPDRLLNYNCLDACVTSEVYEAMMKDLEEL